jgi:hypothetical protein
MKCRSGETVAALARRSGCLAVASSRGTERLEERRWVPVPLSYVCRDGDRIRVAAPESPRSAEPIKAILRALGAPL